MRRFNVFILGVVLGAALLWVCAFAGVLGFTSVEGASAYLALLLLVIVLADVTLGGLLARVLLFGNSASRRSRREAKGAGLFVGGSVFVGAVASGLFLGAMILLDLPARSATCSCSPPVLVSGWCTAWFSGCPPSWGLPWWR